jgi:hypothetical protein
MKRSRSGLIVRSWVQLEGKIQQHYGLAKDQVRKDVDDWFTSQGFKCKVLKMLLARLYAGLSFVVERVLRGIDFHRLQNLKAEPS